MGCSNPNIILFCPVPYVTNKSMACVGMFEPILFIPCTVVVLSDKIFTCVSDFSRKLLDQRRQLTVPRHLCVVAVRLK